MRIVLVALALLVATPAVARADTIVFRRGGDVWRMAPDGSGQVKLTEGGRYAWPSAADDGTIVAADDVGRLQRMTLDGVALGTPIPTAATTATEDAPAEPPTHVRISPDGTKIAYDQIVDGDATTLWTPATATGLELPNQSAGQTGLVSPSWIGNQTLLLSRDVAATDPGATFRLYDALDGDDAAEPWFSDEGAIGYDAAAGRAGTRIAVVEDDAADHDGTPTRVTLRLFTAAGPGAPPALRCELPLEASDMYTSTSPAFSPDGGELAFAQTDGIHVADLGTLTDCGAIRQRVVTSPGAWEPYWTPAGAGTTIHETTKLELAVTTRRRQRRATLKAKGLRARITVTAPAKVRISVRVTGKKRFVARAITRTLAAAGTRTVTVPLRARALEHARRLTLRVAAAHAQPVTTKITVRKG
jgi:hypothetical protein